MNAVNVELDGNLATLLAGLNLPVAQAAQELIILELYRRGTISSGKAADLANMERMEWVRYASRLGIPFFEMQDEEWEAEKRAAAQL